MKTRRAKRSGLFLYVVVGLVGMLLGVIIDQRLNPLTPDTCDSRLAQVGAPIVIMDYVCHGKAPQPSR